MPETSYILAVLAIVFCITFALRSAFCDAQATAQREGDQPHLGVDARWHLVDFGALNISQQHRR